MGWGQVKASVGEDAASLAALRKWDQQYGDSPRRATAPFGF
jgi:hypothetical protein